MSQPLTGQELTDALDALPAYLRDRYSTGQIYLSDWPYECAAKDQNPDAKVYLAEPFGAWWHS